jgi:hypothetical protein
MRADYGGSIGETRRGINDASAERRKLFLVSVAVGEGESRYGGTAASITSLAAVKAEEQRDERCANSIGRPLQGGGFFNAKRRRSFSKKSA